MIELTLILLKKSQNQINIIVKNQMRKDNLISF